MSADLLGIVPANGVDLTFGGKGNMTLTPMKPERVSLYPYAATRIYPILSCILMCVILFWHQQKKNNKIKQNCHITDLFRMCWYYTVFTQCFVWVKTHVCDEGATDAHVEK